MIGEGRREKAEGWDPIGCVIAVSMQEERRWICGIASQNRNGFFSQVPLSPIKLKQDQGQHLDTT